MNLTDVDTEIEKTVDLLIKCPKSQEENLIRKLRGLWEKRTRRTVQESSSPTLTGEVESCVRNVNQTGQWEVDSDSQ